MKFCKILCLLLALLTALNLCVSVSAEESVEVSEEVVADGYAISYGYKPLQASNGVKAANYVKGPTPPTEYVSAGGSHKVAENDYTFRDYVFVGWSCNGKLYQPGEVIYNIQSSMQLTATWGRCSVDSITVIGVLVYAGDEAVNLAVGSSTPLKSGTWQTEDGKIFTGDSQFLMSFTLATLKSYSAETETFKVSYNGNGASDGIQSSFRVAANSGFTVDDCFGVRNGYKFIGWEDASGKIYLAGDTCTANGDTVLTAKWQENSKPAPDYCSVSLSAGEGGSISPEGKSTVLKGDTVEFSVRAEEGYQLSSVICDGEELGTGGSYIKTVNADMVIKASFAYVGIEEPSEEAPTVSESETESFVTESKTEENEKESSEETIAPEESASQSNNASSVTQPDGDEDKDDDQRNTILLLLGVLFIVAGGWFVAISVLNKKKKKKRKSR